MQFPTEANEGNEGIPAEEAEEKTRGFLKAA
jgi:hypothetical protein